MKPPDEAIRSLVAEWLEKAGQDFDVADHLVREGNRFREAVGFHCQQAVEKYVKALLVRHQIEFPKTHDIKNLLDLLAPADPETAQALSKAQSLTPYGVEVRYPGDLAEALPGEDTAAVKLASEVREEVTDLLGDYLSGV